MKILFVMHYPGYLRYFDSTVRLLAERGHTVHVAFDSYEKQEEGTKALDGAGERIVMRRSWPKRRDRWTVTARFIRAVTDYCHYLRPELAGSRYLRGRMSKLVADRVGSLTRVPSLPTPVLNVVLRSLLTIERAVPSSEVIEEFLTSNGFDLVVVSPLVTKISPQTDMIKSAQAIGVPVALAVTSWDHLTTKGLIRCHPDLVIVWNETQRNEAAKMHLVPDARIVVTGAQPFDRWFERRPSTTREEFCQKVGLPADRQFVMFAGSTASISSPDAEQRFVRRWVSAIRDSGESALADLGFLIRPHPYNMGLWPRTDVSELGDVSLWPRDGANPVDEADRADYFDSLYHSAAVVGINTSAMIEAAIIGRPVLTVQLDDFADTQTGTVHFSYLLPEHGGFVRAARALPEHCRQLAEAIKHPELTRQQTHRFVSTFVRPCGIDRPCTPLVVDALETLGAGGRRSPAQPGLMLRLLKFGLAVPLMASKARRGKLAGRARRALRRRRRLVARWLGRRRPRTRGAPAGSRFISRSVSVPGRNGAAHVGGGAAKSPRGSNARRPGAVR